MNWDRVEGNWKQFKGGVRQLCGKITWRPVCCDCGSMRKPEPQTSGSYAMPSSMRQDRSMLEELRK